MKKWSGSYSVYAVKQNQTITQRDDDILKQTRTFAGSPDKAGRHLIRILNK